MRHFKVTLKYCLGYLPHYFLEKSVIPCRSDITLEEYERRLKEAYKGGSKFGNYYYYFVKVEELK